MSAPPAACSKDKELKIDKSCGSCGYLRESVMENKLGWKCPVSQGVRGLRMGRYSGWGLHSQDGSGIEERKAPITTTSLP